MSVARSVSPGGALLRTSRLFSLPAPIPPSPTDVANGHYGSLTATPSFPTHQVITTLNSSRQRGDWGLKRPLPLWTTTKSTNAMLRVKKIDTIEDITDFSSATDQGLTLRKFQELNIPLTVPDNTNESLRAAASNMNLPKRSVFEKDSDFTAIDSVNMIALKDKRWKFQGPWLGGMSPGQFAKWVAKSVRPRRAEFRMFLKQKLAADVLQSAIQRALDNAEEQPEIESIAVSDEQLTEYLRHLRGNPHEIYEMVGQFLDLAPLQAPTETEQRTQFSESGPPPGLGNPYSAHGPPVTHPSAGLSYLRTSEYLDNHPLYGPQASHPPVLARVLRPKRQNLQVDAKFGVAGFVVDSPGGDTASNSKFRSPTPNGNLLGKLDVDLEGGAKMWTQPTRASINANGRVSMIVKDARAEEKAVAQELLGGDKIFGEASPPAEPQATSVLTNAEKIRRKYGQGIPSMSNAHEYGLDGGAFRF
ncbi:mitochondrial ribosomal protein MRP51 [Lasiosphaeria hispida]|uniref:Mitochondrial ribosomal protein MRP51 n=1 Tax=Lasiosphaeria hispida TaxID=260671 RepID=A0AAJ0MDA9_9PEZI|nr:mitochondrial ribosomal protein MRP51 [Lasiosphaeria hispida]